MSPAAFGASVRDRLKNASRATGRPFNELAREFVLQRFLARVFDDPQSPWILKGGTGLLVRLPGARYSKDLDLLHRSTDLNAAVAELTELSSRDGGDPFRFVLGRPAVMTGGVAGATISVTAYLGTAKFGSFPVDLSTELTIVAAVERQRPLAVIDMPALAPMPEVTLYPLPDQVADKLCAMYERYGAALAPSTRWRDLVDLLLIIGNFRLDAEMTLVAMTAEAGRRGMALPGGIVAPSPSWARGYTYLARRTTLPSSVHDLDVALQAAGGCFNPLLGGEVVSGSWDPAAQRWTDKALRQGAAVDDSAAAWPPGPHDAPRDSSGPSL